MKILYKLTTRSRPDKMFRAIQNIRAMAVEENPWIVVTLDKNDSTLTTKIKEQLNDIPNVFPVYGYSKNKIDAINRDVSGGDWDIIVATSDDIHFMDKFDEQIKEDVCYFTGMQPGKHTDFDCTVWYGDGAQHGKIMTVPIMTKKYYQRLGYIYNPVYVSLFCDEEAIHVGEKLGKIYYSEADILVHLHPAWGKAEWDPQYRRTDSFYPLDKRTFEKRKALNFPI